MIFWILPFVLLKPSVCAGALVLNVMQESYQAEENNNITLEWKFTPTDIPSDNLSISCYLFIPDHDVSDLYHVLNGAEVPKSQDERFAGRVQSDKDALREGRIRLRVSRLRTNDSGRYMCEVNTPYGLVDKGCRLNVTHNTPAAGGRGWTSRYIIVGVEGAGIMAVCAVLCLFRKRQKKDKEKTKSSAADVLLV